MRVLTEVGDTERFYVYKLYIYQIHKFPYYTRRPITLNAELTYPDSFVMHKCSIMWCIKVLKTYELTINLIIETDVHLQCHCVRAFLFTRTFRISIPSYYKTSVGIPLSRSGECANMIFIYPCLWLYVKDSSTAEVFILGYGKYLEYLL